jgi:hypothetical protein
MTERNGACSPDGTGLPTKRLTPGEILDLSVTAINRTVTIRDLEIEGHTALGRIDALALAGLVDLVAAKEWSMRIFHASTDRMLSIREGEA